MNFKSNLALIFSFISLIICVYILFSKKDNVDVKKGTTEKDEKNESSPAKEAEIEIAHFMTRIQVFHNKLYFAGKEKNKALVDFYLNELEEEMGVIAEAGVFSVDGDISANMKTYGLKMVEMMRKQTEKNFDTFEDDFNSLTSSCNSCHTVTKHDYVNIIVPTTPIFTNQQYSLEN